MTLKEYLDSLKNKTVSVIGLGISNRPLIRLLCEAGIKVTARDKAQRGAITDYAASLEAQGCALRLGEDYLKDLTEDVIFRTPGLHPRFLKEAEERGAVITSEMEAFFQICPCPIIGITGSDGKTTTSTVIAGLLTAAGHAVHLGGNIGTPLLDRVPQMHPEDYVVVELSSFQLLTMKQSPSIAVLTNLAPNHLDVHTDMNEYVEAKENIFLHQSDTCRLITNMDNELSCKSASKATGKVLYFTRISKKRPDSGAYVMDNTIHFCDGGKDRAILPTADIRIPGDHNIENYMAAICAVQGLVPDEVIRKYARTFNGVEHRIELFRERRGVRWYNDSIASSPSRTIAGLRSFQQKVILIAGGKNKGISYESIGPVINDHVKLLILCGATAGVIRDSVINAENYHGLEILDAEDYPTAVHLADTHAEEGDVVILSPASTSFDRFKNFMERGQVFKDLVNALPE